MKTSTYILQGLAYAAGVVVYVVALVAAANNVPDFFRFAPEFIFPILGLPVFVFSAAVTGLLVFGRPAYLYTKGMAKEALFLLAATLAWLAVLILIMAALFAGIYSGFKPY